MSPSEPAPTRTHRLHAFLLALGCAVLFLQDALIPGRALVPYPPEQFDVQRAEARANGTLDLADARRGNTSGGDKYLQSLAWDRIMADRFATGEVPLWTRDVVGGAPFVPQMAQVYEPINLLLLAWPSVEWYGIWFLLHQVLFGFFCYLFLRRLGITHLAALLGLVTACLGLWTQCKVHHNVILTAALPLWPMLSAVWDLAHRQPDAPQPWRRRRSIAWLALWTGVSWLSGFAVVSLQVSYLVVGFALLLTFRQERGRRLQLLLGAGTGMLLGGVLSLAHMVPVLQASMVSARDSAWNPEFLAAHGLEWDHALTALWPDLLTWASDAFYPDPQQGPADITRMPWSQLVLLASPRSAVTGGAFQSWVETSFAIGTIPFACVAIALFDRQRLALAAFFAAAGALAFGFALADEPLLSLARFVPGIGAADLRRLLFTVAMAGVVLTGLGADRLLRGGSRWPAFVVLALGALGSLVLVFGILPGSDDEFVRTTAELIAADADHPDVQRANGRVEFIDAWIRSNTAPGELANNRTALATTAWRALLVAAFGLVGMLLVRTRRGGLAMFALVLLTGLELWHAGRGPVQTVPAARITTPPAIMAPVLASYAADQPDERGVRPRLARLAGRTEGRIASWYPGNLPGFHGIEDATGYNPLPARRFEDFFEAIEADVVPPTKEQRRQHPDKVWPPAKANVAFKGSGVGAFHDVSSLSHPLCDLFGIRFVITRRKIPTGPTLVDRTPPGTGTFRLLERTTTLPRATFVRTVDRVPDRRERLTELARRDRDCRHRLILEDPDAPEPSPVVSGADPVRVTVASHTDERVVLLVDAPHDGYVRLADPYDPGWRATLDGTTVPVYAADHYLRAVYVPAGQHEVVFTYDRLTVRWPRWVSLAALLAALLLYTGWPRRRA